MADMHPALDRVFQQIVNHSLPAVSLTVFPRYQRAMRTRSRLPKC